MSEYSGSFVEEEDFLMEQDQRELIDAYFDTYEEDDDSGMVSRGRGRRNPKKDELMSQMDKGFAILFPTSKHPIAYFHTNANPGSTIRNAVTGIYESGYKFGSANEDLFFKVGQSCSGTTGYHHILFYDTPEQYEKHFCTTVNADMKSKWSEKSMRRRREVSEKNRLSSTMLPTIVK